MAGHKKKIIVIGGGASGILAAISAKKNGADVVVCDRMKSLGRKILASGNGRCNLLNDRLDSSFYNPAARHLVSSIFSKFGKKMILDLFSEAGLHVYSESGRFFPVTNQSASVVSLLERAIAGMGISVEYNFNVDHISNIGGVFSVSGSAGRKLTGGSVVLACGGKSYPALGSDGSGYKLSKMLGHKIVEPVPSAVPVVVKDEMCHVLQGQKICANVKAVIGDSVVENASGDMLFTKYGLSGTAILDASRELSVAANRGGRHDLAVIADMVPFLSADELERDISGRIRRGDPAESLILGILPNKFGPAFKKYLACRDPKKIVKALKEKRFTVAGTRGWNEAEFTAGGVDVTCVDEATLESEVCPGIFIVGELLDVDGRRGGYNLAWAWSSGYVAGEAAAAYA